MVHFNLPNSLVDRETYILEVCKGLSVLHLGCADFPYTEQSIASGRWLHTKVSEVAASCIGLDLDSESVIRLREYYGIDNVIQGNAEQLDKLKIGLFELIIAGEIIEHLNNPGLFLETAMSCLKPGGRLIITTTNAFCFRRFIRIPFAIESIHPDHVYYYSHTTLQTLVRRFGYTLLEAHSYRVTNKQPLLPYIMERLATMVSPNLGEGIVHIYTCDQ